MSSRRNLLRALAVWLALFVIYGATSFIDRSDHNRYLSAETHYLIAAESITEDHNFDVLDEYQTRSYSQWHRELLRTNGALTNGQLNEPYGIGMPLLIAPTFSLFGATGVELLMAALLALAFVLAIPIARRLVPDPWATRAVVACALSVPVLTQSSLIDPQIPAAAALTAAVLLTLRQRERIRRSEFVTLGLLMGMLPWLKPELLPLALLVTAVAVRWLWTARRTTAAVITAECFLTSMIVYVSASDTIYGGPTPYSALADGLIWTGTDNPLDYLKRSGRVFELLLSPQIGLLLWAPLLLLAGYSFWLLVHSLRERLGRISDAYRMTEITAALLIGLTLLQLLTVAFVAPNIHFEQLPGGPLLVVTPLAAILVAWASRKLPKLATALTAATTALSVTVISITALTGDSTLATISKLNLF